MKAIREELDRIRHRVLSMQGTDCRNEIRDVIDVLATIEVRLTECEEKAEYAYEKAGGYAR